MIDWQKVAQDLEKENARLKKDLEQFQMSLAEQVELNKNIEKNLREFGMKVANTVNQAFVESVSQNAIAAIVDGVMQCKSSA
jgi:GH18 family chitinase